MPKELESYRDTLEDVLEFFDGKRMLKIVEVVKYTGLNHKTVKKRYPFNDGYISAVVLSRELSKGGKA